MLIRPVAVDCRLRRDPFPIPSPPLIVVVVVDNSISSIESVVIVDELDDVVGVGINDSAGEWFVFVEFFRLRSPSLELLVVIIDDDLLTAAAADAFAVAALDSCNRIAIEFDVLRIGNWRP